MLDEWFEQEVKPRLRGQASLIRYADDFVIGFEHREDAERVMTVLGKRLERFHLSLQPDKTRLVDFRRPPRSKQVGKGRGPSTFWDLRCTGAGIRGGGWHLSWKTRKARLRRAIQTPTIGVAAIDTDRYPSNT